MATKTTKPKPQVIPIANNREVQVTEIHMEAGDLIRIGIYTKQGKTTKPLSGAVFPAWVLDDVIKALQNLQGEYA